MAQRIRRLSLSWTQVTIQDKSRTFEDLARSDPSKCLEALAAQLGLHYDKIFAEVTGCEIANNRFVYDSGDEDNKTYYQPLRQNTKRKPHKSRTRPTT
jgi:hypothetical protein